MITTLLSTISLSTSIGAFAEESSFKYGFRPKCTYRYSGTVEETVEGATATHDLTIDVKVTNSNESGFDVLINSSTAMYAHNSQAGMNVVQASYVDQLDRFGARRMSSGNSTTDKTASTVTLVDAPRLIIPQLSSRNEPKWQFSRDCNHSMFVQQVGNSEPRLPAVSSPAAHLPVRRIELDCMEKFQTEKVASQPTFDYLAMKYDAMGPRNPDEGDVVFTGKATCEYVLDRREQVVYSMKLTATYTHVGGTSPIMTSKKIVLSLQSVNSDSDRHIVRDVPPPMSAELVEQELSQLKSNDPKARRHALFAFYRNRPTSRVKDVMTALASVFDKLDVRDKNWCMAAMRNVDEPGSLQFLEKQIDAADPGVRLGALMALSEIVTRRSAEIIARRIEDNENLEMATKALQKNSGNGRPVVAALLTSTNPTVRRNACRVLGHIGTKAELPAIVALQADGDEKVAAAAKSAAKKITARESK